MKRENVASMHMQRYEAVLSVAGAKQLYRRHEKTDSIMLQRARALSRIHGINNLQLAHNFEGASVITRLT